MNMLAAAARGQRIEYVYGSRAQDAYLLNDVAPKRGIDLHGFTRGACEFLATNAKQMASVGSPYVAQAGNTASLEFTAAIRVVGERSGTAYFSASRAMLTIMLMRMGAIDITHDSMRALLARMASAMASAARLDIGDEYLVQEPIVSKIRRGDFHTPSGRALVVPIQWRKFTAKLVLCMD